MNKSALVAASVAPPPLPFPPPQSSLFRMVGLREATADPRRLRTRRRRRSSRHGSTGCGSLKR
ncbi:hypothetical protein glysoja_025818 [Glycine soja]|uniref:Uncharacterized protein n=1 Tax=Glycine soja TaxID=3848 RepID=A0A0B2RI37_GLYSO|nr:hypothetical protein glysoja_025818 [Glycine soja]